MYTDLNLSQAQKASSPIEATESGMLILIKLLQEEKASFPMEVTESGRWMLDRLLQPAKVKLPIEVTELGISRCSMRELFKYKLLLKHKGDEYLLLNFIEQ